MQSILEMVDTTPTGWEGNVTKQNIRYAHQVAWLDFHGQKDQADAVNHAGQMFRRQFPLASYALGVVFFEQYCARLDTLMTQALLDLIRESF